MSRSKVVKLLISSLLAVSSITLFSATALTGSAGATTGVPDPPIVRFVSPGDGQLTVVWDPPSYAGTSPITGYTATASDGTNTYSCYAGPTTGSCNIIGLTNGTGYSVSVVATNSSGDSAAASAGAMAPVAVPGVPSLPNSRFAAPGNGQITVVWDPPSSQGTSPITSYTASASDGTTTYSCYVGQVPFQPGYEAGCNIIGLTNGVNYFLWVVATNSSGNSASASEGSMTPRATVGVPGRPNVHFVAPGNGQLTVAWYPPSNTGTSPISGYTASAYDGIGTYSCTAGPSAGGCNITGLTNGTNYYLWVVATNGSGDSAAAPAGSMIPRTVPGPPTLKSVVPGNGQLIVSWLAPASDGGSPITRYTASAVNGTNNFSCNAGPTSTSCAISGLTNGKNYGMSVIATNSAGNSSASNTISMTPRAVPNAPTLDNVLPGNGRLVVLWTPSSASGGTAITSYTASASGGGNTFTCTASQSSATCAITGLTNGTIYTVSVFATNLAGNSPASTSSISTPFTVPESPTLDNVSPGNGQFEVGWTGPLADGGSAITSYTASATGGGSTLTCVAIPSAASCTILGLTNGTTYSVSVVAVNAAGNSLSSSTMTSAPRTVPGIPTIVHVTPGNNEIAVTWIAPSSDGGSAITSYTVSAGNGTKILTCRRVASSRGCTVNGLDNGTSYTVSVVATNVAGNSTSANGRVHLPSKPGPVTISFAGSSALLNGAAKSSLQVVVNNLDNGASIVIHGYAHNNGSLARKRATAVSRYLSARRHLAVKVKVVTATKLNAAKVIVRSQ